MDIDQIRSGAGKLFDLAYDNHKIAILIPIGLLLASVSVMGYSLFTTNHIVEKGISFSGGTSLQIRVPENVTVEQVKPVFENATVRTMQTADIKWMVVETKETLTDEQVKPLLKKNDIDYIGKYNNAVNIRSLGSSVGEAFFQEAQMWGLVAVLIMSVVIFIAFRTLVPSLAVIFAAVTDIVVALGGMSLFGIEMTLGSMAGLLMLLGYSVDTDILLSTRVLKQRKRDLRERIRSSILTGSTMTMAAVAAFTVLWAVSPSTTLDQIASVIVIGLLADLPVTWLGNASILKWYVESDVSGGRWF